MVRNHHSRRKDNETSLGFFKRGFAEEQDPRKRKTNGKASDSQAFG